MKNLFRELQRRNVIRGALLYLPAAWGIAQIVDLVGPAFDWPDVVLRNTIIVLALLFPVVLILTWIFELTPDGLKLEGSIDRSSQPDARTGRILDRSIIAVLLVAVSILAVDEFIIEVQPKKGSIAVFPFEDLSQDRQYEYLSDGIPLQILTLLSSQGRFDVIAQETTRKLKGLTGDFSEIRRILDVDYVLLGTIQASPEQVRTYARLVDIESETQIWADTIDAPTGSAFEIQDLVANAVISQLGQSGNSKEIESYQPANSEAWHAYMAGTSALAARTGDMILVAEEEFRRAVELDPDFAAAHAGMAIASALQVEYGNLSFQQALEKALPYAEKAVELAPDLAEAVAALGFVEWFRDEENEDIEQVEALLRRALQLDPAYAPAYIWLSNVLNNELEDYAASMEIMEIGLARNPGSGLMRSNYIIGLLSRDRYEEAVEQIERLKPFSSEYYESWKGLPPSATDHFATTLWWMEKAAKVAFSRPDRIQGLAMMLNAMDLPDESNNVARNLNLYSRLRISMFSGRYDDAVGILSEIGARTGTREHLFLGWVLAHQGHYEDAAGHLETWWTISGREVKQRGGLSHHAAALLAMLRRETGQPVDQDNLLTSMHENVRRMRDAGIVYVDFSSTVDAVDAHYELAQGDHDRAIELLQRAIDDGIHPNFNAPYFRDVEHRPEFRELKNAYIRNMDIERQKVLNIVCNDNPYPEVWTPLPETCEAYLPGPVPVI